MDLSRRQFTQGLLATTAAGALGACVATNQATGRTSFTGMYSVKDDIALGSKERPKLIQSFGGEYDDPKLQSYVKNVGRKLAEGTEYQEFPYDVVLLDSPIVNAFALPGGNAFVTRGLLALASNEAEMAGVISHEFGHINARHTAERLSQGMLAQIGVTILGAATGSSAVSNLAGFAAKAYIQSYSRSQEFEADMLGVRYMSKAGYDPDAMVTFLKTLREHSQLEARMKGLPEGTVDKFNIMSTHPRTIERVEAAMKQAATKQDANPRLGRQDYMGAINGMVYGDSIDQGVVVGQRFVHPALRMEFTAPPGFRLHNQPDKVIAAHENGAVMVFDMGKRQKTRQLTDYIAREWAGNLRFQDLEGMSVNGITAATGHTRTRAKDGRSVDLRPVAYDAGDGKVFRLLFVTPANLGAGMNEDLRRATWSFRRLSASDAAAIQPLRLITIPADKGDSVTALARGLPHGQYNDDTFRLLNDMEQGQNLQAGRMIKVVAN